MEEFLATVSDRRIRLTLPLLRDKFAKGWGYKKLGKRFKLTEERFRHLFRDQVGAGLREYLCEIRLHHVRRLLETTELNLSKIAIKVGFSNELKLRRAFKKKHGINPSEYRDNAAGNVAR
ncbi:MAG: helix-turn-helix transcriptional regulator [Acidobacteria bacterium]|nr:helix-turn-helix transcriptional regulator [Acidobacteriota bacterium]